MSCVKNNSLIKTLHFRDKIGSHPRAKNMVKTYSDWPDRQSYSQIRGTGPNSQRL